MGKALGTVFKIITGSPLSLIDKDLGRTVSGIGLTIAGIATGNPILAGIGMGRLNGGSPKVPLASIDRLTLSLDPGAYRPSVFGQTAMATDARYERPSGTDQRYIDYIIGVAAHRVESIDEIWLDGKIAWSASTGYAAWTIVGGVNRLTVAVRTEGTAGNAINIGGAWNGTARLTGCAYVHIRIDRQGTKKTDSPFAGGLPSALRIIGKGWPLYDPRLDSTRGGSGAHRADDQATWGTASGRENTALQILNHLIGWKIGGALSVGKGVPLDDIDFASFLVEANHCDESVAMVGGGTQPRYRSAGVGNEGDDTTLGALLAACNGELVDVRGKIGLRCAKNDLAVPIAHFETKNILGPVRRSTGNVTEIPNVIRGRYTDASNNALYSMADIPEVKVPGTHAVERVLPFDLPFVQDAARAQRILKQVLQRAQYQDTWDAEYDLTALKCRAHDVITQDFEPRGMVDALFRVRRQVLTTAGRIQQTLRVENAAIYDWDAEEADAVSAAEPQVFDPLNSGAILAAVEAQAAADAAQATNSVNLYRVETAGVVSSLALVGAGAGVEVAFGHPTGNILGIPSADPVANLVLADAGIAVGDVLSFAGKVSMSDTGSTSMLRVRFVNSAGAEVALHGTAQIPGNATPGRLELPNLTVPSGAVAVRVVNRTNGGTGTATIREVMVNRGPICAPYSPPTRGATSNVNRGAWSSASVVYSIGDEVLSQGSTWGAKVGHVSSGGNGPPSLPTTENTNWILRSAKGDAGASGTDGDPGYTLNVAGNVAKVAGQPASLNCATSSASWGHGSAYSSQVFVNGAALWFNTPNTHGGSEQFMIGLNDNPGSSTGFADIDHALYFREDIGDVVEIYESGTARTLLTGGTTRAWSSANKYGITYDGRYVRYWEINGTTATKLYENDVGANKAFGLDVSAYHRLSLTNIAFSPKGADGLDAVTVSPPSVAYSIACDSAGNPKAGEFNKVTTFAVLQGTVDLSDHADTDYSVSNTNCSATMGGTNGKVLTQTAMSAATAKSVVTIQRSGVTVSTVDVSLTKALEGASARRVVDDTISAPSSSSYGSANGGTLEMALNTGDTAIASFSAGYAATSSGSFFVSARIEYREKGSPTWLLLDSEAAGSIAIYLDDPGSVGISVDLVGSGGLKVYEFQLLLKRSNTGPTMNWNPGKFQVSVS